MTPALRGIAYGVTKSSPQTDTQLLPLAGDSVNEVSRDPGAELRLIEANAPNRCFCSGHEAAPYGALDH